jgi:hypothetical protein
LEKERKESVGEEKYAKSAETRVEALGSKEGLKEESEF